MAHKKSRPRLSPKPNQPSNSHNQEQRIKFLKDQLDDGIAPYQAYLNASEKVQFNAVDAQLFRLSLIQEIEAYTKRPLIVYEAHFSKGSELGINAIGLDDKIGFCSLTDNISDKNIDIMIQSPGGSAEVVEQIVYILRKRFEHIRFIIPDAAKSAATMLALSGNCLLMDERSELGPIDPQVFIPTQGGYIFVPADTIIQGFENAKTEIQKNPNAFLVYDSLLRKYDLHTFEICRNVTNLAKSLVSSWLSQYMFDGQPDANERAESVAEKLCAHSKLLSHGRPITLDICRNDLELSIIDLHDDPELRKNIWLLHNSYQFHLDQSPAIKIYENSKGTSWNKSLIAQPSIQKP